MGDTIMDPRNDQFVGEFEFLIKSKDRISGTTSRATFALNQSIIGLSGMRMKYFQSFNVFQNINVNNNVLQLSSAVGGLSNVIFTPGHYISGTGCVTITQALADPTTFTNDIRYVLMRNILPAGRIISVCLEPSTAKLTIEMYAPLGNTYVTSVTTADWLGYEPNGTPASSLISNYFLNLGLPQSIAISAEEFHNKGFVDTYTIPSNDFLDVVPVYSDFSDMIYYEPINPIQLQIRNIGRALGHFTIRFVDPVTRLELPMTDWQMGVVFRATSIIP